MALGKERPKPRNLFVCKPEKIAHLAPHILAALNHAGAAVSRGSLGPERSRDWFAFVWRHRRG